MIFHIALSVFLSFTSQVHSRNKLFYDELGFILQEFGLFQIELDTTSHVEMDRHMLASIDSISETTTYDPSSPRIPFDKYPEISFCASFNDLDCIKYYRLNGFENKNGLPSLFEFIFYNHCNNNIYYFQGEIAGFNAVFGPLLAANYNKDFILDLLHLYLYVGIRPNEPILLLGDANDIAYIYRNRRRTPYNDNILRMIKLIQENKPEYAAPITITKMDSYYKVFFNTWGGNNDVARWRFSVYPDSICIEEKSYIGKFSMAEYDKQNIFERLGIDEEDAYRRYQNAIKDIEGKSEVHGDSDSPDHDQ